MNRDASQHTPQLHPAIFLDRDGTLHEDVDFLTDPADLRLFPETVPALRELAAHGFLLVVITNQSGIARGMLGEETLRLIHARLDELLAAEGAHIDAYYHCPHHPCAGSDPRYRRTCECRKPAPGMIKDACAELALDPGRSWFIGDSPRDLMAAEAAQVRSIWVQTGRTTAGDLERSEPPVHPVARVANLLEAVRVIEALDH